MIKIPPMRGDKMLSVKNVNAGYGNVQVLHDVSFEVKPGEFVAMLGQNGAGKTTMLRTISNIIKPTDGTIVYNNEVISALPPQQMVNKGISFVTDDGNLFSDMSVMNNIMLGAYTEKDNSKIESRLKEIFELFPRLEERKRQRAETLSGGERKMLAIARGLMSSPSMLLVDEPSLGLAPILVLSVFQTLRELANRGVSVLLVEQNVNTTLKIVDRAYVLDLGHIVQEGSAKELQNDPVIMKNYLGID